MRLTEIESCFRINKHDLKIRPVFYWKQKRVRAHILVCYMATTGIVNFLQSFLMLSGISGVICNAVFAAVTHITASASKNPVLVVTPFTAPLSITICSTSVESCVSSLQASAKAIANEATHLSGLRVVNFG